MEQDRKPRNKPTHIWSINIQQKWQSYTMDKDNLFNKYKNWTVTGKRIKLEHLQTPHTKTQSGLKI